MFWVVELLVSIFGWLFVLIRERRMVNIIPESCYRLSCLLFVQISSLRLCHCFKEEFCEDGFQKRNLQISLSSIELCNILYFAVIISLVSEIFKILLVQRFLNNYTI